MRRAVVWLIDGHQQLMFPATWSIYESDGGWDLGGIGKFCIADQMAAGDRAIECHAGAVLPIYLFIHHRHCRLLQVVSGR